MGLGSRAWSSGGDPSCEYDSSNGGHWFFTEIVSASPEASGGAFTGCFAGVANECYEGIAVSQGSSPFGPYNVYFLNADYNPAEPGYPSLLNDFAKIGVTRDAFLLFYDEFPLKARGPGSAAAHFNGAQEFAFDKNALERGRSVTLSNGQPNLNFNVAHREHGPARRPRTGTCAGSRGRRLLGGGDPGAAGRRRPVRQPLWRVWVHDGRPGLQQLRRGALSGRQPDRGVGLDRASQPEQRRLR